MSNSADDQELMDAIRHQGDRAEEAKPKLVDTLALAGVLAERFPAQSTEEVRKRIQQHFRSRGLFWAD